MTTDETFTHPRRSHTSDDLTPALTGANSNGLWLIFRKITCGTGAGEAPPAGEPANCGPSTRPRPPRAFLSSLFRGQLRARQYAGKRCQVGWLAGIRRPRLGDATQAYLNRRTSVHEHTSFRERRAAKSTVEGRQVGAWRVANLIRISRPSESWRRASTPICTSPTRRPTSHMLRTPAH